MLIYDITGIREENIFPICQCCEAENQLMMAILPTCGRSAVTFLELRYGTWTFQAYLPHNMMGIGLSVIVVCPVKCASPVSLSLQSPGNVSVPPPGSFSFHFHHSFFWTSGGFLDVWIWDDRNSPVSNWKYPGICPVFNSSQTSHNSQSAAAVCERECGLE